MARQVLKEKDLPPEVLIQSEGDTRYLQQYQTDARYLQLTGGTITGNLTVDSNLNANVVSVNGLTAMSGIVSNASFQVGAAAPHTASLFLTDRDGSGMWYAYNSGGVLTWDSNEAGRMVVSKQLDISAALTAPSATINSKAVNVSPDGGNALEWRTNGFYAGGGGGGSFSSIRDEEFAPAAASTAVDLAATPTNLVVVARNGVIQSQAAGNYSLAGSTITFTDAFVAGERVAVVYEIGVAAGDLAYTKNDSDLRFVNVTGDTMTGNLQVNANVGVGVAPAAWWSGGRVLQIGGASSLNASASGQGLNLQDNTYYDGTSSKALVAGGASSLSLNLGAMSLSTAPSVAAGAAQTFTTRLTVDQAGNMGLGAAVPTPILTSHKVLRVGTGIITSDDPANPLLSCFYGNNVYHNGTGWTTLVNQAGSLLQMDQGGDFRFNTVPATAPGTTVTPATRMIVAGGTGTVTLTSDTGAAALICQRAGATESFYVTDGIQAATNTRVYASKALELDSSINLVCPARHNAIGFGQGGLTWTALWATNGAIQTCRAADKDILGLVDPLWALGAVLNTPVKLYHPKNADGVADETLTFAGIVDDSADPRMQIGDGSLTSPTHQAALLMAAVQELSNRVDALMARLPA